MGLKLRIFASVSGCHEEMTADLFQEAGITAEQWAGLSEDQKEEVQSDIYRHCIGNIMDSGYWLEDENGESDTEVK